MAVATKHIKSTVKYMCLIVYVCSKQPAKQNNIMQNKNKTAVVVVATQRQRGSSKNNINKPFIRVYT